MSFDGMRVLALESRRAEEIAQLIRKQGGEAFVAPSMREAPLKNNEEAFATAERLLAGEFDTIVFLTGVGVRALNRLLAERHPAERFRDALRGMTVVARGPKPVAALREMDVPVAVRAPEPNTWREVLAVLDERLDGRRIAVQEYGRSNPRFLDALRGRGAEVTAIRIYQWDLPEDVGPLREAARGLAAGRFDVAVLTTPNQVVNLFRIAEEDGIAGGVLDGLRSAVVASIGPSTSEMLESYGVRPDMEPSHPRMGFLIKEAAEQAAVLRARKRGLRGEGA